MFSEPGPNFSQGAANVQRAFVTTAQIRENRLEQCGGGERTFMGSSWSGFVPQNDIVRLQWALLEVSQKETAAKALSILLGKAAVDEMDQSPEEPEEETWPTTELGFRMMKAK